jgi:hypothetical protein
MGGHYIIEVMDHGRRAFVAEAGGQLFLTRSLEAASRYPTELDAKCAKVYVGDNYQPRVTTVEDVRR